MATTWKKPDGDPLVITGELHTQVGGYLDDTNPSMSIELDDNVSGPKAQELTRLLGYALRQHSMATTAPPRFTRTGKRREPPKGWTHMGLFEVDLGGPKSVQEIRDIYNQLRGADPRISGHTTDANGKMGILVDKGLEEEMARKADETLGGRYNMESVSDGLDVNWPSKGEDDYGLSRQSEEPESGSPLREQADRLRDAATAQLNAELDRAESGSGRSAESPVGTEHSVQPQRGHPLLRSYGMDCRGHIRSPLLQDDRGRSAPSRPESR